VLGLKASATMPGGILGEGGEAGFLCEFTLCEFHITPIPLIPQSLSIYPPALQPPRQRKLKISQVIVAHPFNPSTWEAEVSLVYRASSRTAKGTQRTLLKNKQTNKQKKTTKKP
jgi:hypothetical protein